MQTREEHDANFAASHKALPYPLPFFLFNLPHRTSDNSRSFWNLPQMTVHYREKGKKGAEASI